MNFASGFDEAIFVVLGSVIGSWLRFKGVIYFDTLFSKKYWSTCFINLIASFLVGFVFALQSQDNPLFNSISFILFVIIGFLGSLSTFSSFVMELFFLLKSKRIYEFFRLTLLSICGGLLAVMLGYVFGTI